MVNHPDWAGNRHFQISRKTELRATPLYLQ
jgi:hypothetical protein